MKKRNINIDLIKCVAIFSVISVHFFLNTEFYKVKIIGSNLYLGVFLRTVFMVCVPLFIIATGYLMKNKSLNRKYYYGIFKVLIIYLLCVLLYLFYNSIINGTAFNIKYIIKKILAFNTGYSWYVEMYLGLFLIIPFINLIYNDLKSKKHKQLLLLTMLIMTSFQGIYNSKYLLIPDWWINIYPLTYYFIGCYLREYKIHLNKYLNIFYFVLVIALSGIINICFSHDKLFVWGIHNDWGSIFNVLSSTLLFIFILNLNLDKIPIILKKIITRISELSLGIYLTSSIVDNLLYSHCFKGIIHFSINGYLGIIPFILIISTCLSVIIHFIYELIDKYILKRILLKLNYL